MAGSLLDLLYPSQAGNAAGAGGLNMGLINTGLGLMRPGGLQAPGNNNPLAAALAMQQRAKSQQCQPAQQPIGHPLYSPPTPQTPDQSF